MLKPHPHVPNKDIKACLMNIDDFARHLKVALFQRYGRKSEKIKKETGLTGKKKCCAHYF